MRVAVRLWIGFGIKVFRWEYASMYVPDKEKDELVAITFSQSEEYIERVTEIELD